MAKRISSRSGCRPFTRGLVNQPGRVLLSRAGRHGDAQAAEIRDLLCRGAMIAAANGKRSLLAATFAPAYRAIRHARDCSMGAGSFANRLAAELSYSQSDILPPMSRVQQITGKGKMTDSTKKSLGPEYEKLNEHVFMLNLLRQTYNKLFTTNDERIQLLKGQIPGLAGLIRELLADAVILGICRVTDPPQTVGHGNLTLAQLLESLSPQPDAALAEWLACKKSAIDKAVSDLKKHRNQRLAHNWLSIVKNPDAKLPPILTSEIDCLVEDISDFMAKISESYLDEGIDYGVIMAGDADNFIAALQRSERLSELQHDVHVRRLPGEEVLTKLAERSLPNI